MGKKGQRNKHGGKVQVGKGTPSFGGGKVKELRSQSIKKFICVDIEIIKNYERRHIREHDSDPVWCRDDYYKQ